MKTVQAADVQLSFGERTVLKEIQLTLTTRTRAALTGGNGSGKSTLMKILNGTISPDSGKIAVQKGTRISYLPQSGRSYSGRSLRDETETAFSDLHAIARSKREIEHTLGTKTGGSQEVDRLLEEQHSLEEELLAADYYNREKEIEQVLTGLGFSRPDFGKQCEHFSGGWQMRIALAKVLLEHPDILLLDEPTNYLDIEARNWLESFLLEYRGGFLIVSHDRYFLDTTVNETCELFLGRLRRYPGNYSQYLIRRKAELEELSQRYEQQQQEIERLNTFIQKFRYNASKARQVQSRVKYLEKLELIELPTHMQSIHFSFPPAPHSGKKVLELKNIGKSYGRKEVLQDVSLELRRGEKLVVTGINGAGKSTLLRIIAGVDGDFSGELSIGTGVDIGYFSQEQTELEADPSSIIDLFEREAPTSLVPRLRSLLGAFLFQGDDIYKSLQVLSGGERSRIALLRLLLQPHNLLVLDEPTNHLDIHSKDVLLDALQSYNGTLVFVSHDRYFIEHLASRVVQIGGGGARNFPGDYAYYLYRLAQEEAAVNEAAVNGGTVNKAAVNDGAVNETAVNGGAAGTAAEAALAADGRDIGYQQSKQVKNRLRKLESEEAGIMERIESLEESHLELQEKMALPEIYSDGEQIRKLQHQLKSNEQQHAELSRRWEAVLEEKESLQQEYGR